MTPRIPKIIIKKLFFVCLEYIRMSGKNINFTDKKIKKSIFYKNRAINNIKDINADNLLVSKQEPYRNKNSFKYFIGYYDNDVLLLYDRYA